MIVYAESSAVVTWLLGEAGHAEVGSRLAAATRVVSSRLTLAEARRALVRAETSGRIGRVVVEALDRRLRLASAAWDLLDVDAPQLDRVGRRFPVEPIRTLDAVHLAAIEDAVGIDPGLVVLALDARVRDNATAMGLSVAP